MLRGEGRRGVMAAGWSGLGWRSRDGRWPSRNGRWPSRDGAEMTRIIDKIAWIQIGDGKILSTRSRGADGVTVQMTCYTADHRGTPVASSEIEEISWLSYRDRDRVSPVDQIIFDQLHQAGQLR